MNFRISVSISENKTMAGEVRSGQIPANGNGRIWDLGQSPVFMLEELMAELGEGEA